MPEAAGGEIERLVAAVKADLEAAAGATRSPVRWVSLDGLHITLRFLGPTPEARANDLAACVDRVAAGRDPIGVTVAGTGAFPSPARPRTLWLGLSRGVPELRELARSVDVELVRDGWPAEERPFRAHLTLARADGRLEGPLAAQRLAERASRLAVPFEVDRLVLFESVTGGGPARYVVRHEARLGTA